MKNLYIAWANFHNGAQPRIRFTVISEDNTVSQSERAEYNEDDDSNVFSLADLHIYHMTNIRLKYQ